MTGNRLDRRPVAAAMTASLLTIAFGVLHHVLSGGFGPSTDEAPLDPAVFSQFPMQIGQWMGEDMLLDDAIVRRTGTDAHLSRRYSRSAGTESISLYVGSGVRIRELVPHRPEVCYVSAGWTRTAHRSLDLPLVDGTVLAGTISEFCRGVLNTEKIIVLHYYIVDGCYCRDASLLLSKAWRNVGTSHYAIQVQIVAPAKTLSDDSGLRLACAFAADSAASMSRLVDTIEAGRKANSLPTSREGDSSP